MKREEILQLEAGRELDALIAEHVLEAHQWKNNLTGDYDGEFPMFCIWEEGVFLYADERDFGLITPSSFIGDAWDVVEKLSSSKEWDEHPFELIRNYAFKDMWEANFNDYEYGAVASTAPLAICRAALLAVMEA